MSKFRLEDHVRVIRPGVPCLDQVGVVKDVPGMVWSGYEIHIDGLPWYFQEHDLILADAEREAAL